MKPHSSDNEPEPPPDDGATVTRKVYRKPRLQVYGDLAEITGTIMGMMTKDGSAHPNMHFTR